MITRLVSRTSRILPSTPVELKKEFNEMDVPDDLLNPLLITEEFVDSYLNKIISRHTYDLQDDFKMIWIALPKDGYGDIKPFVLKIRTALLEELKTRPPIRSKPRLEYRLKKKNG